jgi:hypothetical protein
VRDQKCSKNQNKGAKMFDFKIEGQKLQILQNRMIKLQLSQCKFEVVYISRWLLWLSMTI